MNSLLIMAVSLMSVFLSSCGNYYEEKSPSPTLEKSGETKPTLGFASVNKIVFSARCVSCHQQYGTYEGVVRELAAIQSAVATDRMPKSGGPLTDHQKAILTNWIANGAPNDVNRPSEPLPPSTLEPTWKSLSENVLLPKCTVCHSPRGEAKFLDLSNRQVIFENRNRVFGSGSKLIDFDEPEKSAILEVITDDEEPMPPAWSKIPRLTPGEIKTLKEWMILGLP